MSAVYSHLTCNGFLVIARPAAVSSLFGKRMRQGKILKLMFVLIFEYRHSQAIIILQCTGNEQQLCALQVPGGD